MDLGKRKWGAVLSSLMDIKNEGLITESEYLKYKSKLKDVDWDSLEQNKKVVDYSSYENCLSKNEILDIVEGFSELDDDIIRTKIYSLERIDLYHILNCYNFDDGIKIPSIILEHNNCDLALAMYIFDLYNGESFIKDKFIYNKDIRSSFSDVSKFCCDLFEDMGNGKYRIDDEPYEISVGLKILLLKKGIVNLLTKDLEFLINTNDDKTDNNETIGLINDDIKTNQLDDFKKKLEEAKNFFLNKDSQVFSDVDIENKKSDYLIRRAHDFFSNTDAKIFWFRLDDKEYHKENIENLKIDKPTIIVWIIRENLNDVNDYNEIKHFWYDYYSSLLTKDYDNKFIPNEIQINIKDIDMIAICMENMDYLKVTKGVQQDCIIEYLYDNILKHLCVDENDNFLNSDVIYKNLSLLNFEINSGAGLKLTRNIMSRLCKKPECVGAIYQFSNHSHFGHVNSNYDSYVSIPTICISKKEQTVDYPLFKTKQCRYFDQIRDSNDSWKWVESNLSNSINVIVNVDDNNLVDCLKSYILKYSLQNGFNNQTNNDCLKKLTIEELNQKINSFLFKNQIMIDLWGKKHLLNVDCCWHDLTKIQKNSFINFINNYETFIRQIKLKVETYLLFCKDKYNFNNILDIIQPKQISISNQKEDNIEFLFDNKINDKKFIVSITNNNEIEITEI